MRVYLKLMGYLAVAVHFSTASAADARDLFKAVEIDAPHLVTQALRGGVDPNVRDDKGQVRVVVSSIEAVERRR